MNIEIKTEDIKKNLSLIKNYKLNVDFALINILNANICIPILNNTKEGNVFNLIINSLWLKAIVDLRKILEPNNQDKTANLQYLINKIIENKNYFADKHYNDDLAIETHHIGILTPETNPEYKEYFENRRTEHAKMAKQKCLEQIDLLKKRWDKFWNLLSNEKKSFSFIKDKRDLLVHSIAETEIYLPPINKIRHMLSIVNCFIEKIDFIVNNSSTFDKILQKQLDDISNNFWTKIK